MVQGYHSLFPLEDVNREDDVPSTSFGVRTMIFKGISSSDGQAYAIRRIDSRQVAKAFTHMHMRLIYSMYANSYNIWFGLSQDYYYPSNGDGEKLLATF
jgi:hypothetical protein